MTPSELTHAELATLAREYFLAGHLIDRAGMPHAIGRFGRDGMTQIAIEEWMGASPIYTRRMQRLLGFERDDVAAIFQGMQLDIGAPPEFMDFRYEVSSDIAGEFRLAHCGALMDVEPMGEDYVVSMCHHIEDPTFDATAVATNARAQVRPVHRPPRSPVDRHPHCHWTVRIEPESEPVVLPNEVTDPMHATLAATTDLAAGASGTAAEDAGWGRYETLDPDLRMEDFSASTLTKILDEAALQGHLLAQSFGHAVARRSDATAARVLLVHQFIGVAGVVAGRLADAYELPPDLGGIASVLRLHPAFEPAPYVRIEVDERSDSVHLCLLPCDAAVEPAPGGWIALLADGMADEAVTAIARGVCDRASASAVPPGVRALAAWEIRLGDQPHPEHPDVTLTKFSTGATFQFRRTGQRQ